MKNQKKLHYLKTQKLTLPLTLSENPTNSSILHSLKSLPYARIHGPYAFKKKKRCVVTASSFFDGPVPPVLPLALDLNEVLCLSFQTLFCVFETQLPLHISMFLLETSIIFYFFLLETSLFLLLENPLSAHLYLRTTSLHIFTHLSAAYFHSPFVCHEP